MSLVFTQEQMRAAAAKRAARVAEALAWPGGTQQARFPYPVWQNGHWEVSLNKPGKEAAEDYNRCNYADGSKGNNPSDMLPLVRRDGVPSNNISFADVFRDLLTFTGTRSTAGAVVGALLVRSAYMADHVRNEDGNWRYAPCADAIAQVQQVVPEMYGVTIEAFLHYLDALAWNEDVKYHTLGYEIARGYGRINNMLTYAHIVAAAMGVVELGAVIGGFSRPPVGTSSISMKRAFAAFPSLGTYWRG